MGKFAAMTLSIALIVPAASANSAAPEHWSFSQQGRALVAIGKSRRFGDEATLSMACLPGGRLVTVMSVARRDGWRQPSGETLDGQVERPAGGTPPAREAMRFSVVRSKDVTLLIPERSLATPVRGTGERTSAIRVWARDLGLDGRFEFPLDGYRNAVTPVIEACKTS